MGWYAFQRENREWLEKVEVVWRRGHKDQKELNDVLQRCFESVSNPYNTVIYLIQSAPDYSSGESNGNYIKNFPLVSQIWIIPGSSGVFDTQDPRRCVDLMMAQCKTVVIPVCQQWS